MRDEARVFIKTIVSKMSERNPMSTVIARSSDAFDPKVILHLSKDKLKWKAKNVIQKLVALKIVDFKCGDQALREYGNFTMNEVVHSRERFVDFNKEQGRLDDFFFHQLGIEDSYPSLAVILKVIFCLSHGQASVERGFNDNNVVLKDNMAETTIIARRLIKNYLNVMDIKPHTIEIKNELLKSVKCARLRYETHLEEQRKLNKENKENEELTQVNNELQAIVRQCSVLSETISKLDASFVDMIAKAEKTNSMYCVMCDRRQCIKKKKSRKRSPTFSVEETS